MLDSIYLDGESIIDNTGDKVEGVNSEKKVFFHFERSVPKFVLVYDLNIKVRNLYIFRPPKRNNLLQ